MRIRTPFGSFYWFHPHTSRRVRVFWRSTNGEGERANFFADIYQRRGESLNKFKYRAKKTLEEGFGLPPGEYNFTVGRVILEEVPQ